MLIEAITDDERFVSATWSGALPGATPSSERVTLRPVDLKVGRRLQLSVFDGRTTVVTNLEPTELAARLEELFERRVLLDVRAHARRRPAAEPRAWRSGTVDAPSAEREHHRHLA